MYPAFRRIEIVSEKDAATYARVLAEFDVEPARFVMIGNSLRSDIVPVLELGGWERWVLVLNHLAATALLGSVMLTMVFGHWYLVIPRLSIDHLMVLTKVLMAAIAVRIVSILASPAIPRAAAEAWRRIGLPGRPQDQRVPAATEWGQYPGNLPVEKAAPLFPRIKP